jgi:hypothetical protein
MKSQRSLAAFVVTLILLVTSALLATELQEGAPLRVETGPNIRVSDKAVPHIEPYIAAHPDNPQNLTISASQSIPRKGIIAKSYFTTDGGKTWSSAPLPKMQEESLGSEMEFALDNWVAYAPDGSTYYSSLARMKLQEQWRTAILVYRSAEQGKTWQGPTLIPSNSIDRPAIVATGTKDETRLYIAAFADGKDTLVVDKAAEASGIAVLESTDRGVSFKTAAFIAHDNLGHTARNPLVLSDGSLLVPYIDFPAGPEHRVSTSRIYTVRSEKGSKSFSLPNVVADLVLPNPSTAHFAVDLSGGRFNGRVYAVWNGGDDKQRDVSVAYSADNGKSWSKAAMLRAQDKGPCTFGAVAVARDGTVGVAWIQDEKDETKPDCYRLYFSASVDGGATFSQPSVISDAISCPDSPENKEARCPV